MRRVRVVLRSEMKTIDKVVHPQREIERKREIITIKKTQKSLCWKHFGTTLSRSTAQIRGFLSGELC